MENDPAAGQPENTNLPVLVEQAPAELEAIDATQVPTPTGEDNSTPETTQVSQEDWDRAYSAVVGNVEAGTTGLPYTTALGIEKTLQVDRVTAAAIFEEMQARGIITKIPIAAPGKHGSAIDRTKFGNFMVLVSPDGSTKNPYPPYKLRGGHDYEPVPVLSETAPGDAIRRRGKLLGRFAVGTGQVVADYTVLKAHHIADSADFLSGQRTKREKDGRENNPDRLYEEIFDPRVGMATGATRREPNGQLRREVFVPSWMDGYNVKPWERTVPPLEILPSAQPGRELEVDPTTEIPYEDARRAPRTAAEREVYEEIRAMRNQGVEDDAIKTALTKKYHPDNPEGGDYDKVAYVTQFFMRKQEKHADPEPAEAEPDESQTVETPSEAQAEEPTATEPEAAKPKPEKARRQFGGSPSEFALEYLAGLTRHGDDNGEPFPQMAEASLVGAFDRHQVGGPMEALRAYKDLRELGLIDANGVVDVARVRSLFKKGETQADDSEAE